jgi:hypothetical protein
MRRRPVATLIAVAILAIGQAALLVASQGPSKAASQNSLFAGDWTANIPKSKRHPKFEFQSSTLRFMFKNTSVTITGGVVFNGKEQVHSETFRTDGTETPASISPGVVVSAQWISPRVLETVAKKDAQTVAVATYEVAADGKTLVAKTSGAASFEQVIVYERK